MDFSNSDVNRDGLVPLQELVFQLQDAIPRELTFTCLCTIFPSLATLQACNSETVRSCEVEWLVCGGALAVAVLNNALLEIESDLVIRVPSQDQVLEVLEGAYCSSIAATCRLHLLALSLFPLPFVSL